MTIKSLWSFLQSKKIPLEIIQKHSTQSKSCICLAPKKVIQLKSSRNRHPLKYLWSCLITEHKFYIHVFIIVQNMFSIINAIVYEHLLNLSFNCAQVIDLLPMILFYYDAQTCIFILYLYLIWRAKYLVKMNLLTCMCVLFFYLFNKILCSKSPCKKNVFSNYKILQVSCLPLYFFILILLHSFSPGHLSVG